MTKCPKPRICFVAQNSYKTLTGEESANIGGVEMQMPMMARWFAQQGYPVSMICWDEGYGPETTAEGIKIISICGRDAGIPGIRFITPRWTGLVRALTRADPEIIYYNYGDLEFGQIVLWAQRHDVPVVYSAANNMVCLKDLPSLPDWRDKWLYKYGLVRANRIIVQTTEQKDSLEREFGLDSVIIPMPNPGFHDPGLAGPSLDKQQVKILWVGRFTEEKRLEWLLDLAERFPEYHFDVVGGANVESKYASNLVARAHTLTNVQMHGKVLPANIGDYYRNATLLISTSRFEGFPNVYLEAWSVGLPVVATIDPDGVIQTLGLGATGKTQQELATGINSLLDEDAWHRASTAAKAYYETTHAPELVLKHFENEIVNVLESHSGSAVDSLPKVNPDLPSVCLIAHNAYGVLANVKTAHVGGIEVQVPLMSKWLSSHGYRATMIAWDHGYRDGVIHDGVVVRKLCRETDGIRFLRFFYPRWTSLIKALSRANADICYYNCGDLGLGQVVLWARLKGRKVVYSIANDVDCVQALPALKPLRERVLYRYGLKRADRVICQTDRQKQLLADEFGIDATVIRMPSEGFPIVGQREAKPRQPVKHILWAGRFTPEKRLEWFFELAKQFPDIVFDVLGDFNVPKDLPYANRMKEEAKQVPNVILHGRVPHEEMGRYFNASYLLCSTSVYEGFPNIYLEGWSVGLPLVTTFDPDNVVTKFGHGRTANDVATLTDAVAELLDEEKWMDASNKSIAYFQKFHSEDAALKEFDQVFRQVIA